MPTLIKNSRGFTLIELMLGMTVFGFLMISILQSVASMSFVRIKTENRVKLLEELYFFSENLVTNIKGGGALDFEEYWNRNSSNTLIGSGHYMFPTGAGNYGESGVIGGAVAYGSGFYLCRSGINNTQRVGTGGCLGIRNSLSTGLSPDVNYSGSYQRYGQYALQFLDYNGNADADGGVPGDEDGNGFINDDEDDKDIGDGPNVLSGALTDLYLIDKVQKTRTFFRWIVRTDPNAPVGVTCTFTGVDTGSGCIGNVQILRLRGIDFGLDHTGSIAPSTNKAFDGEVDTWICHADWACAGPLLSNGYGNLATGSDSEWIDMFPDTVNVKSVRFTAFPKKDPWKAWGAVDALQGSNEISPFIHPYVRVELTLGFSYGKRVVIKGDNPLISVNTTISLGDN